MEYIGPLRSWEVWEKCGVGLVTAHYLLVEDGALVFYRRPPPIFKLGDDDAGEAIYQEPLVHHVSAPGCWTCAVPVAPSEGRDT